MGTEHARKRSGGEWQSLLAAEIHDGFVQGVVGAHMVLQGVLADGDSLEQGVHSLLTEATSHLSGALAEARRVMDQLAPMEVTGSLVDVIADWICEESQVQACHEIVTEGDCQQLAPYLAGTLFRIAQESVRNADVHGKANKMHLYLVVDDHVVTLTVADDGCGFDPNQPHEGRFGLRGMRQRARWFGGDVTVDSIIGEGTTVRAELPLAR